MNQSTAKSLRKAINFKVHKPRKYEITSWSTGGRTYKAVEDRADYQRAKKDYLAGENNAT